MNNTLYDKMLELIIYLNHNTKLYDYGYPEITDSEWDRAYFKLQELEKEAGYALPQSPTQSITYEVISKLEKIEHNHPMLSLPKTKDINDAFTKFQDYLVMLKMDGLTCSLTYENGILVRAETRGDGVIGENILHNAKVIKSIPQVISYMGTLTVDGEIICKKDDFEEFSDEFKNPRNFAAGSIRLLDAKECAKRKLTFVAWDAFFDNPEYDYLDKKLQILTKLDFLVVPFFNQNTIQTVYNSNYENIVEAIKGLANAVNYPIDGLVIKVNSDKERKTFNDTAHHLGGAIALKFEDEKAISTLLDIVYEPSRNGILTPVAVFDPVELEGSIVSKASLHNLDVMYNLCDGHMYVGDTLTIIKANQIIPQIVAWEPTGKKEKIEIPSFCPVCNHPTRIKTTQNARFLICENPDCDRKLINQLDHFLGKKGLDIKGLSKATLEKLISYGWIEDKKDIFNLHNYRDLWIKKPGFGEKSVDNILTSINIGKETTLQKFICSLGIPEIGTTASKAICKIVKDYDDFRNKVNNKWNFSDIEGFGIVMEDNILNFDYTEADAIVPYLVLSNNIDKNTESLKDLKFVITGSLYNYKNRDSLKADIESKGGKVVGSISKQTSYLICNDKDSGTSKVVSAQKYGVPIITEKEFIEKFLKN